MLKRLGYFASNKRTYLDTLFNFFANYLKEKYYLYSKIWKIDMASLYTRCAIKLKIFPINKL